MNFIFKFTFVTFLFLTQFSSVSFAANINTGINCTLSQAILSAQTDTSHGSCVSGFGSDTIFVNQDEVIQSIPSGVFPDGENAFKTITTPIVIIGNNKNISFQNNSQVAGRMFNVIGGNLEINNLNFVNLVGSAPIIDNGGFMLARNANVKLNNVKIDTFLSNVSGGAIFSENSNIKIAKSKLIYNVASGNDYMHGGGALYLSGGSLNIVSTLFDHNNSVSAGGAIFTNGDFNNLNIESSIFTFNSADYSSALNLGLGSTNKSVNIKKTTFENNYANIGSTVSWRGWDGSINFDSVTFYDNKGFSDGAAFENSDGVGKIKVINSTFSTNESFGIGSAILNKGEEPKFIIGFNTFASNNSNGSGGAFTSISSLPWGSSYLENNIFYQNIGGDCNLLSDVNLNIVNNLSDDGSCGQVPATGVSSTISNNGGQTKTHRLLFGSNALDAAVTDPNIVSIQCPVFDQRGVVRPFDANSDGNPVCDIGSFELNRKKLTNSVSLESHSSKESKQTLKNTNKN